jgi:hypothetical protein
MGPSNWRFAIATVGLLLHDTHALIESASTARVRSLIVEPHIGGKRRAPEQHNQASHQEHGYRSHESTPPNFQTP